MQHAATNRSVHRRLTAAGFIGLLCLATASPGTAQVAEQPSASTPSSTTQSTPPSGPTPIPASDIPTRAAAAAEVARQAVANAAPDTQLQDIEQRFPAQQARINELREATTKQLQTPGPASAIQETEKASQRASDWLARWLVGLSTRSSALDATLDDLQDRASLWRLTRDHESGAALPKALIKEVAETLETFADAENQVRSARDSILDLQASIAQEKSGVDAMVAQQQQEINQRTTGAFGVDSPPLWRAFGADGEGGDARRQFADSRQEQWRSLKTYITEQAGLVLVWVLLWAALALLMVFMQRKAAVWAQQDTSLQAAVTLLSRPVSAAFVVTAIFNEALQHQAPSGWTGLVSLLLVLAVLRVLPPLLPKSMRLAPLHLVLLYVLHHAVKLAPQGFVIHRLALLALAAVGVAACVWLIRLLQANPEKPSKTWHRAILFGAHGALILYAIGAVADVIGSVEFSRLALTGTTYGLLAAVLTVVMTVILQSLVRIGLLTDTARRMGLAPDHSETVRTVLFRLIGFLAVVGWAIAVLRGFLLLDPLLGDVRRALEWRVTIGEFSIAPGDLLIFGFIIWLSFKIATFVQFVLNVDLMPRVDLPRGVPQTISRLARFVVIGVGAVVASAAVGLDINKITIIFGALGVGVGFGLQNIVNNFVSGLILLFERPIRIGDTLELDSTGGVVKQIGLRASVVSTWDGAEIVVPNAKLISEDVINWTLTHDRRRMVIPVGVAYGTDPEKAAQLIVDIANDHKEVDARPEPTCLFVGLGDSSLDLELCAWTAVSAYRGVAGDLRFAIVRELTKAGIEIPFPQRDIHVRTPTPPEVPANSDPQPG